MLCIFTTSFAIGNGSMMTIYCGEILPSAAMGLAFASRWIISALNGIASIPIGDAIGKAWLFVICGGFILLDLIVLNIWGYETLGKTPSEIDELFMAKGMSQELQKDKIDQK